MGGAASKDFIEHGAKAAISKELDALGGYDRRALARNESFSARLEWLGTQVGKASESIEAALAKDETGGRRELEREAKRRQLVATRRGNGDYRADLQYADFYLKQKQYERLPAPGPGGGPSLLRKSSMVLPPDMHLPPPDELSSSKPSDPKSEAARRSADKVAALNRVYSKNAGSFTAQGPPSPNINTAGKWRQTVQHAKKTAFLAINSVAALNGNRARGPARIDNFGMYAEQQLGEGMHKYAEESERLEAARVKMPGMKAELEALRVRLRQLAVETAEMEEYGVIEDEEAEELAAAAAAEAAAALENDGDRPEDAAAVAAAAAANVRGSRHSMNGLKESNKPKWSFTVGGDGFGPPPSITSLPKPKPFSPRPREPAAAHGPAHPPASPSLLASPLPSMGPAGPPPVLPASRRRTSTGSPALFAQSVNGPPLTTTGSLPGQARPGSPVPALAVAGPGSAAGGRGLPARASWSGGSGAVANGLAGWAGPDAGRGGATTARATSATSASSGAALRPSRPALGSVSRMAPLTPPAGGGAGGGGAGGAPAAAQRSQSEPPSVAGAAAMAALGAVAVRPTTAMRRTLAAVPPRQPAGGRPGTRGSTGADTDAAGEYRPGTMAQRIGANKAQPHRKAVPKSLMRALRESETANVLRQQQLLQDIEEGMTAMQSASGLLNMFCNRANGRWVEAQHWSLPHVHDMSQPAVRRQAERYKEVVMKDLKEGRLAVQVHVDDDVFTSGRLGAVPLWSADPWQLLAVTHPSRVEAAPHLVGLGMGIRQLLALATAVEALAGTEALGRLPVVVACHEGQVDAVVRDLSSRKLCRFSPENVTIIVQPRAPGHLYDKDKHAFVPAADAPPRPAGSGYALLALGWTSDAFRLGGKDLTERIPLERSALDAFAERGVEWLLSWRLRDLVHYSPEACLNVEQVAVSYALMDSVDANMTMQVEQAEQLSGGTRLGSGIVLALKERAAPAATASAPSSAPQARRSDPFGAPGSTSAGATSAAAEASNFHLYPSGGGVPAPLSLLSPSGRPPSPLPPSPLPRTPHSPTGPPPALRSPPSFSRPGSSSGQVPQGQGPEPSSARRPVARARAGGIGGDGGPLPLCDVKWSDVQTPALASGLQQLMDLMTIQTGTQPRLAVSIKRYAYHIPSLRGMLTGPSIFRPAVSVEGGYLYVTFDASDISGLPAARCAALSYTPRPAGADAGATPAPSPRVTSSAAASKLLPLPPVLSPSNSGGGSSRRDIPAPGDGGAASSHADGGGGADAAAAPSPRPRLSSGNGTVSAAAAGAGAPTVSSAAAAAAALALQRGRLVTNDTDLDTLLHVVAEQDSSPLFRATVSLTNTARSRTVAHAGGVAARASANLPGKAAAPAVAQQVIVVAVADDAACPLAVRVAMAVMRPGAVCLHVLAIAKDGSMAAVGAARVVAERFESMASATLGDVKSVVQVKSLSIVEDIVNYAEAVNAVLLVTGSVSLAAPAGSSVVGSVALSVARECSRPVLVVKPSARLAESAFELGKKPCLRCLVPAEPSSRPLVRFVVSSVLDGRGRGDKLVLLRGKAFDKDMNELSSSRRILDHVADEASSSRSFDASLLVRRMAQGSFDAEYQKVADVDQCHIVGVQVPEGRGPLPNSVIELLRNSRSAVLLYRNWAARPAPTADGASPARPAPTADGASPARPAPHPPAAPPTAASPHHHPHHHPHLPNPFAERPPSPPPAAPVEEAAPQGVPEEEAPVP